MLILWGKNQDDLVTLCVCTETLSNIDLRDSGLIRFYAAPSGDEFCAGRGEYIGASFILLHVSIQFDQHHS